MGRYKRVEDILGAIEEREQIHGLIEPRVPPALKYKKGHKPGAVPLPDLKVGTKLVLTCTSGSWGYGFGGYGTVTGYALGIVVDFHLRCGDGVFYSDAKAIIQVVKVTHADLLGMVGRLHAVNVGDYHQHVRFVPEQVQLLDFKWIEEEKR